MLTRSFLILLVALVAVSNAYSRQLETPGQGPQEDNAVTAPGQSADLASWLNQIQNGSPDQRRGAAQNPPMNADPSMLVDALLIAANDVHVDVSAAAIYSLGHIPGQDLAPFLREKLNAHSTDVQEAAIWTLLKLEVTDAHDEVSLLLLNSNTGIRTAAAWYFARGVDISLRAPLLASLADSAATVRTAAVWGLSETGNESFLAAVRSTLQDSNRDVRAATCMALGTAGDQKSRGPLRAALADSEPAVRTAAATALTALADPAGSMASRMMAGGEASWDEFFPVFASDSVSFLAALTRAENEVVRQNAARILGESNDPRAGQSLHDLAASFDLSDRLAASYALAELENWPFVKRNFAILGATAFSRIAVILFLGVLTASLILTSLFFAMQRRNLRLKNNPGA